MTQLFPIAAITDEFATDLESAVTAMAGMHMTGAELRMLFGKNIIDLSDEEIDRAKAICEAKGLKVISIASPLLKCTLPNAPEVDARFQQDMFAAKHTIEDQPRLAERAFEIAKRTGARIVRVFSYWRTVDPERCFDRVVEALHSLAKKAAPHDLIIGLENEHACNIATAAESARVLNAIDHPNLKLVWDPCNAFVSGEDPYPPGYSLLPVDRIVHVHAKDCRVDGHRPIFSAVGEGGIEWRDQIKSLAKDGYKGYISLETHWPGPNGDKFMASVICGRNLRALACVA